MPDGLTMGSLPVDKGSIIVSSLPSNIDEEDIVMYFQSRKHGGGDIKEVSVLGNGVALITFEDQKCAQKVLEKEHVIKGVPIVVKQCAAADDQDVKLVFSRVSAKIDPADLHLSIKDTREMLQSLQEQMNVKCMEGSDATFVVSGSYQQIVKCHNILCDLLSRYRSSQVSIDVQNGKVKGDRHENCQTRLSSAKNQSGAPFDKDFNDHHTQKHQDTTTTDEQKGFEEPCSGEIEVSKAEWRMFSKVYKKQLIQLMKDNHVTLEPLENVCKVLVKPTEDCSKDMLNRATKRLSDMYHTEQQTLKCEMFCLVQSTNEQQSMLRKAVLEINKMGKIVIERAPDRQSWEIFGKIENVEEILQSLGSIVEIKRLNLASEQAGSNIDEKDNMDSFDEEVLMENGNCDDDDEDDDDGQDLSTRLVHDLGCVKVSVYKGDITNETSDVIVNAANQSLSHDAGVARAIVCKGGQSIQDESRRIINTKGKLETGDATITPAGNLNCKMVVHAVGPIWNRKEKEKGKNLLKKAFLSSVQQAEKYRFNSIAFPAISSGIYGMPKKVCAQIMFDAVEEYNRSPSRGFKVRDVRFVNNDLRTVKVFQKEFKTRYGQVERRRGKDQNACQVKDVPSQAISVAQDQKSKYHHEKGTRKHDFQHNRIATVEIPGNISGGSSWTKPQTTGQSRHTSKVTHQSSDNLNQNKRCRWRGEHTDAGNGFGGARPKQQWRGVPGDMCNSDGGSRPKQRHDLRKDTSSKKKLLEEDQKDQCPICLAGIYQPTTLPKCKHTFCTRCLREALKKSSKCPLCRDPLQTTTSKQPRGTMVHRQPFDVAGQYVDSGNMYNDPQPIPRGRQPSGTMQHRVESFSLPGYENHGTILIQYSLSSGIQGPGHPNPGQHYASTTRTAYLPDNQQGRDVMKLLKTAFDRGLVFTVGRSMTSGYDNQIVWGDIPHKTCINGGPSNYGYPDATYLTEVQQILKAMLSN